MGCSVKILADSIAPNGSRLTTFEVEHWRAIHAEVLRHRMFSFSAASSRAIPGGRMIDYVESNPAGPLAWTTTRKGMQGGEVLGAKEAEWAEVVWERSRLVEIEAAKALDALGVHKSISNRRLEPFAHIRCVITGNADAWMNFWALRLHWDAEPSIQQLAKMTALAWQSGTPKVLAAGEWHLPYITEEDWEEVSGRCYGAHQAVKLAKISAARCARVSYKTHDGRRPSFDEDIDLYRRLVKSDPKHASPTEHQAYVELGDPYPMNGNLGPGWVQHRKLIVGERATAESFDLAARLALYRDVDFLLEVPAT